MSYVGTTGEISAIWRSNADVRELELRNTTARLVAPGSVTNGQFGLFRWDMRPQAGGLSGHFHKTFSESFYILDGKVRLYNGEIWVEATAGDFFHAPPGGIHGFHIDSDADASMMIVFAPAHHGRATSRRWLSWGPPDAGHLLTSGRSSTPGTTSTRCNRSVRRRRRRANVEDVGRPTRLLRRHTVRSEPSTSR